MTFSNLLSPSIQPTMEHCELYLPVIPYFLHIFHAFVPDHLPHLSVRKGNKSENKSEPFCISLTIDCFDLSFSRLTLPHISRLPPTGWRSPRAETSPRRCCPLLRHFASYLGERRKRLHAHRCLCQDGVGREASWRDSPVGQR